MSQDRDAALAAYVDAAAQLLQMPLSAERVSSVAAVITRIAQFASDLTAFELSDDVEVAGTFTP